MEQNPPRRLLVVDDDQTVQELLRSYFEKRGWEVHAAGSAADGIRLFRRFHPACVILDLMLGDRSGFDLCDQIRDDISSERTAIVMLTGAHRRHEEQLRGRVAGADDYVLKPFQLKNLEDRVEAALRLKNHGA